MESRDKRKTNRVRNFYLFKIPHNSDFEVFLSGLKCVRVHSKWGWSSEPTKVMLYARYDYFYDLTNSNDAFFWGFQNIAKTIHFQWFLDLRSLFRRPQSISCRNQKILFAVVVCFFIVLTPTFQIGGVAHTTWRWHSMSSFTCFGCKLKYADSYRAKVQGAL